MSDAAPGLGVDRAGWALRTVSVLLLGTGLGCVVALHVLRSDLDPTGHRLSEYAIGPYGPTMTAAFVSIGSGLLLLAGALARAGGRWSRAVAGAIAGSGVGMLVAGAYRTDPDRSGVTTDAIHSHASALATIALIAAALTWSVVRTRSPASAASFAILAAVLGALSPAMHRSALTGVSQRLLWLTLLAWLISTAWRLRPSMGHDVSDGVSDRSGPSVTIGP